jgi:hypothetical protein
VNIVLALPDPLVITNDNADVRTISIEVDPYAWLLNQDLPDPSRRSAARAGRDLRDGLRGARHAPRSSLRRSITF